MADKTYDIVIQVTGTSAGIDQAIAQIKQLGVETQRLAPYAAQAVTQAGEAAVASAARVSPIIAGIGSALGLSIAGALTALPILIQNAGSEAVKLSEAQKKSTAELEKQVTKWIELAEVAQNAGDVLKVGDAQLASLKAARDRFDNLSKSLTGLDKVWNDFKNFLTTIPGISPDGAVIPAQAAALAAAEQELKQRLTDFRALNEIANQTAASFERIRGEPVAQGIAEVTTKVTELKTQAASLFQQTLLPKDATPDQLRKATDAAAQFISKSSELKVWIQLLSELQKAAGKVADELQRAAFASTAAVQNVQSQIKENLAIAGGDQAGALEARLEELRQSTFSRILNPQGTNAVEAARVAEELVNSARQRAQAEEANKTSTEGERDARREISNLLREDSALLRSLQAQQKLISENPTLGADARQSLLGANALAQQQEIQLAILKTGDALLEAFGSGNQDQVIQLQSRLEELKIRFIELGFTIQQSTFGGSLQKSLADWVNGFGNAGQQIGQLIQGTVNASLQGTNQLLIGAALHSGNWRQTLVGVEQQILNLFLTWIEQMALQRGAQLLGITTTTTAQVASGGAIAAAHGPAAAATSISSYGAAAIIGEVLAVAAIAAIIAALSGGFKAGGYTGDGDISSVAGVVHRREFVVPADATERLGVANLHNLVSISRQGGYLEGGLVGGGSSSGSSSGGSFLPQLNVLNFFDIDLLRGYILDHPDAAHFVVNHVNRSARG